MAFYKLNEAGEAERVSYDDWRDYCGCVDMSTLVLAQHDIIATKQLKALAVRSGTHGCKVLATVKTRMLMNTGDDSLPPWETFVEGEEPEYRSTKKAQALEAHRSLVNRITNKYGGRVLLR